MKLKHDRGVVFSSRGGEGRGESYNKELTFYGQSLRKLEPKLFSV